MISVKIPNEYRACEETTCESPLKQDFYTWDDVFIIHPRYNSEEDEEDEEDDITNFDRFVNRQTLEYTFTVKNNIYTIKDLIGKGGSSDVFLVEIEDVDTYKTTNAVIKIFNKSLNQDTKDYEEKMTRKFTGNKYFIQLFDSFSHKGRECIVMEKLDGCLLDIMGTLSQTMNAYIMKQLIEAVQVIEEKKISHIDLKPENIGYLYNRGLIQIKILDFGLSENFGGVLYRGGTVNYVHEDFFKNQKVLVSSSIDRWSLGCIFHEMVTNNIAFKMDYGFSTQDNNTIQQFSLKNNFKPRFYKILHNIEFSNFVLSCFSKETTLTNLLESPYLSHFSL